MGVTPFVRKFLLKVQVLASFPRRAPGPVHAIPDSGARNPAAQRRAWVRLVVAITAGAPLHHMPAFLNAVFPV
jgi:hypothetical protein